MLQVQTTAFLLALTLLLNLLLTAAKAGFANSRFEKLAAENGNPTRSRLRAARLLARRASLIFKLQTSHIILRFILAGLVVGLSLSTNPEPTSFAWVIGLLVAFAIVLSLLEQAVENLILRDPEIWSARMARLTEIILIVFSPVLALALLIARVLPAQPKRLFRVTEEELNMILDASQKEGVLELDEREMISSIFSFRDTSVREIMVPRIDLLAINVSTPLLEAIDAMLESGFSRVPVFEDNIDHILGVLYIKDLLRLYRSGEVNASLRDHLREAYFIPETKKVGELLTEMQEQRNHMAIVVDEYGGVAGIATLEDIVEEIVGEIQDEYDEAEEVLYRQLNDNEFIFQAKIDVQEFNHIMGSQLDEDTADTLGGLLYAWFGRVPKAGETIERDDILFTIDQVTGRRIRSVRVDRENAAENPSPLTEKSVWFWEQRNA